MSSPIFVAIDTPDLERAKGLAKAIKRHEGADGDDRPGPGDQDNCERGEPGSRLDFARLGKKLVHQALGRPLRIGGSQCDEQGQQDETGHQ